MEALQVLEQKIAVLVDNVRRIRADNSRLAQENAELTTKIAAMEFSYASDDQRRLQLAQEKELTLSVVDGLIERINALSESERQQ